MSHKRQHEINLHGEHLGCSKCWVWFKTGMKLIIHEKTMHGVKLWCRECCSTFEDVMEMKNHNGMWHGIYTCKNGA